MQSTYSSCLTKQEEVESIFTPLASPEQKYQKLIELGKTLPPPALEFHSPENIVYGCQSIVYLRSFLKEGNLFFEIASEALISSGLAALLLLVYNGQPPEVILKCPPDFLDKLGITASLSPGRSNGLASIYLRMKQESLKALLNAN